MQALRKPASPPAARGAGVHQPTGPVERVSAGLGAFFEGVPADRSRAILDLGGADGVSLEVYGRYARWTRFADVLVAAGAPGGGEDAIAEIPENPQRPYDLVLGWDVLDRLPPEARAPLVRRIADVAGGDARLFLLLASPDATMYELLRWTVRSPERLRFEPDGGFRPPHPPVAPADVKPLLAPFKVRHAVTTRAGFREYVAFRANASSTP